MVNEFSASPKPQNKSAHITCSILTALFAVLAVIYAIVDKYRGLIGLAAMIFLVAGIYIYTKYISVKYYYDITKDKEGCALFVIRREVGKRQSTMYMTPIFRIKDVKLHSRKDARPTDSGYAKHSFKPTFLPDKTYHIIVESRLEKSEIIIECGEDFANLLLVYATEERERVRLEEEEY